MSGDNRTQLIVAAIGVVGALAGALLTNWDKVVSNEKPKPTVASSASMPSPSQAIVGNSNVQISGSSNSVNSGNITQLFTVDKPQKPTTSTTPTAGIDVQALLRNGIRAFNQTRFSEARDLFETARTQAASAQDQHLEFVAKSNLLAVGIVEGRPEASVLLSEMTQSRQKGQVGDQSLLLLNIAGDDTKTVSFVGPSGDLGPNAVIVQAFFADTGEPAQKVRFAFPEKSVNWVRGTSEGFEVSLTFSEKQLCLVFSPRDEVRWVTKRVTCT